MAGTVGRLAFKVLTTAVAVPIGRAISNATGKAWQKARPEDPPHNPREVQTGWSDALIWAALTGFGAALAQVLSTKGADTLWRATTGKPSPRPKEPKKPKQAKTDQAKAA